MRSPSSEQTIPHFSSMHRTLFILSLVLLAACSPQMPVHTGIEGQVLIGPMCPVVRQGQECPDRPYQATLTVMTPERRTVTRFTVDREGRFQVALAPGSYILRPETPSNLPLPIAAEQPFSVVAGQYTQLKVIYDSGIR
jgi:hypothetical protein